MSIDRGTAIACLATIRRRTCELDESELPSLGFRNVLNGYSRIISGSADMPGHAWQFRDLADILAEEVPGLLWSLATGVGLSFSPYSL